MIKRFKSTLFLSISLSAFSLPAHAGGWRDALCMLKSFLLDDTVVEALPVPKLKGQFKGAFHNDVEGAFPDIKLANPADKGKIRQLSEGQLVLQDSFSKGLDPKRNPSIIAKIPKKRPNELKLPNTKAGDLVVVRVAVGTDEKAPGIGELVFKMPPEVPTPDYRGMSEIEQIRAKNKYGYAKDARVRQISALRRQAIRRQAAQIDQDALRRGTQNERVFAQEKRVAEWTDKMSRLITKRTEHPEFFIPVRRYGKTNHLTSKYNPDLVPLDVWVKRVMEVHPEGINPRISGQVSDNIQTITKELRRMGIVHGDMHPGSFLIDPETYELKLIDYNSVCEVGKFPDSTQKSTRITNKNYGSPNARSNGPAKFSDDEYSAQRIQFDIEISLSGQLN